MHFGKEDNICSELCHEYLTVKWLHVLWHKKHGPRFFSAHFQVVSPWVPNSQENCVDYIKSPVWTVGSAFSLCLFISMYIYMHLYTYIYTDIYIYICTYVYMYICILLNMIVSVYIYIQYVYIISRGFPFYQVKMLETPQASKDRRLSASKRTRCFAMSRSSQPSPAGSQKWRIIGPWAIASLWRKTNSGIEQDLLPSCSSLLPVPTCKSVDISTCVKFENEDVLGDWLYISFLMVSSLESTTYGFEMIRIRWLSQHPERLQTARRGRTWLAPKQGKWNLPKWSEIIISKPKFQHPRSHATWDPTWDEGKALGLH